MVEAALDVADRTQRLLAKAGLKGRPIPDLIIAAQAELAGLTVLHYDGDFDLIASVTHQPTLWISPPGSID
jgi:predicted nucleic acid-binding protein